MSEKKKETPRRAFLKTASLGAVALGLAGLGSKREDAAQEVSDGVTPPATPGGPQIRHSKKIGRYIRLG